MLAFKEANQNAQDERYLIRNRQNNAHIFSNFCLRHSDVQKRYKTRGFFKIFVRPYVAVSKAKFAENVHIVLSSPY